MAHQSAEPTRPSEEWQEITPLPTAENNAASAEDWLMLAEVGNEQERASSPGLNGFEDLGGELPGEAAVGVAEQLSEPATERAITELPSIAQNVAAPPVEREEASAVVASDSVRPASESAHAIESGSGSGSGSGMENVLVFSDSRHSSTASLFFSVPPSPGLSLGGGGGGGNSGTAPSLRARHRIHTGTQASQLREEEEDGNDGEFATPATTTTFHAPSVLSFETAASLVFSPSVPVHLHGSASASGATTPVMVCTPSPMPRSVSEAAAAAAAADGCFSPFEPIPYPSLHALSSLHVSVCGMGTPSSVVPVAGNDKEKEGQEEGDEKEEEEEADGQSSTTASEYLAVARGLATPNSSRAHPRAHSDSRSLSRATPLALSPTMLPPPTLLDEFVHSTLRTLMRGYHELLSLAHRVAEAFRRFGRWLTRRRRANTTTTSTNTSSSKQKSTRTRTSTSTSTTVLTSTPKASSTSAACPRVMEGLQSV